MLYEDMTVYNGDHIKLTEETREFLKGRGHELVVTSVGGIVQVWLSVTFLFEMLKWMKKLGTYFQK